jgi:hypothetical protein
MDFQYLQLLNFNRFSNQNFELLLLFQIGAIVGAENLQHEDLDPQFRSSAEGLLGAWIFSLSASLILSGLLLYGANTNKRIFLIPWMIVEMLNIIFNGFVLLAALIVYFTLSIVTWGILLFLIPGAVFFGLKIYFW